jgi:hypothetical protein
LPAASRSRLFHGPCPGKDEPAQIEALRAETRRGFAELRLDFHTEISRLTRRVERLEGQRGLVHP